MNVMKINVAVRMKNKAFWITFIPAVLLLVQQVANAVGVELDVSGLTEELVSIIGTLFAVLSLLGVVNDPTTAGVSDSEQAMTYQEPKK